MLFRSNESSGTVSILLNNGSGTFILSSSTAAGTNPASITSGDFNEDGIIDLAVANNGSGTVSILLNGVPSTPQNLTATAGNGQVTLKWRKNTEADFLRYRIYRGTSLSPTSVSDSTTAGITDTTKIMTGLTNGVTYYFRVTAMDSSRLESGYSNEASAKPSNLVAWYKFDGNTADSSGNGNHGTNNGATPTTDRFGNANKAFSFNGTSNYIEVLDKPELDPQSGPWSICAWIASTGSTMSYIVHKGASNGPVEQWSLAVRPDGTNNLDAVWSDGSSPVDQIASTTNITDTLFHHIAFTFNGSGNGYKFYIDGIDAGLRFVSDGTQGAIETSYPLHIGNTIDPSGYFRGKLDDIRIYNRALRAGEIDTLYHECGWGYAPTITSFSPSSNALNVLKNVVIGMTFDRDINPSSINSSSIKVNGSLSGPHTCNFGYNSNLRQGIVEPTTQFKEGEVVNVTATRGIKSISGDSLATAKTWSFTIKSNTAPAKFTQQSTPNAGNTPASVIAADWNLDGALDLAAANGTSNTTVTSLLNDGKGSFAQGSSATTENYPCSIVAGDWNRDGAIDMAVANHYSQSVSILKNNGSGSFIQSLIVAVGPGPWSVTSGDWDGDGALDLAVASSDPNAVYILKNNGNGGFTQSSSVAVGTHPRAIVSGDWDGD